MEGVLGGTGMAGMWGAAVGVASGWGTGQRQLKWEEDQEEEEKSLAERKKGVAEAGRSFGRVEVGQQQSQAG